MEKGNTATEGSSGSSESDGEATATDGGMTAVTDSGGGGGSSAHPPASATLTNPDGSTVSSETDPVFGGTTVTETDADGNPLDLADQADLDRIGGFDHASATDEDGIKTTRASGSGITEIMHEDSDGNVLDQEWTDHDS